MAWFNRGRRYKRTGYTQNRRNRSYNNQSYYSQSSQQIEKKIEKSGKQGEKTVANVLKSLPDYYMVINDVTIKQGVARRPYNPAYGPSNFKVVSENGRLYEVIKKSTQIDHIVVSPFGIFVIETKNHKGMIFGSDYDRNWTQVLAGIGQRNVFLSPVVQNEGHIREICEQLQIPRCCVQGLIVFASSEVNLQNVRSNCCLTADYLYNVIMNYQTPIFNMYQVDDIYNILSKLGRSGKRLKKEHIKYVQDLQHKNF